MNNDNTRESCSSKVNNLYPFFTDKYVESEMQYTMKKK
jgi:hypothetical protein